MRTRPADEIGDILALFERQSAPLLYAQADSLTYLAFSDLIVGVSPLSDPNDVVEMTDRLTTEASNIAAAQCQLSQRGIVIRGAITC